MSEKASKHWLVVADEWDEDGGMEVEHSADCPTEQQYPGVDQYACAVAHMVHDQGLEASFLHRDDPSRWPYADRLDPGRYEIEVWEERHGGLWGPEALDTGLRVKEAGE